MQPPPRRPNLAGVAFSGTEYFHIQSRETAKSTLDNFIESARSTRGVSVAAILGDWGEGKSELYSGAVRPATSKLHLPLYVPASTVANSYELDDCARLLRSTPVAAARFLVALLEAVRSTTSNQHVELPSPGAFSRAEDFVSSSFEALQHFAHGGRAFVFVDEFEELINRQDRLRDIISGLKELVNGEYADLHVGGRFEGFLQVILACTPAAYYRISREREVEQVFGGFGRRVARIDLAAPRKSELIQFIEALLRWSWQGRLPTPHPFRNTGVHEALAYVTRGNLGNLVQLVSKVLSVPDLQGRRVVDGGMLLELLSTHKFTVFGAEASALEVDLYREVMRSITEQSKEVRGRQLASVFNTICGEHIPHSSADLKDASPDLFRTNHEVTSAVAEINQTVQRRFKVDRSVVSMRPLEPEIRTAEVIEKLVSNVDARIITDRIEGRLLVLDGYRERVDALEDRLNHYYVDEDGKVSERVFLPVDDGSAKAFFEGITAETAQEIVYAIAPRSGGEEFRYLLAESLKTQLFPSPIPLGLEFVVDREKRLQIWRLVGRDLESLASRYFPSATASLVERLGPWATESVEKDPTTSIETWVFSQGQTAFRVALSSLLVDPKKADVRSILERTRRTDQPAHLAILFYTGDLSDDAQTALEASGYGPKKEFRLVPIPINAGLLRRITAIQHALSSIPTQEIDEETLHPTLHKLLSEELDILPRIDSWLERQAQLGLVIESLADTNADLNEQVRCLRFFLNYPSRPLTLDEVWAKTNSELLALQFFGGKKALVPDIEQPEFQRFVSDLVSNRFLAVDHERYSVTQHPTESLILQILSDSQPHPVAQVSSHFVDRTGSRRLENVFLEILKNKGRINVKGGMVQAVDLERESDRIASKYHEIRRGISETQDAFDMYGLLYVKKRRAEHWISYSDWLSLIERLTSELVAPGKRDEGVRGPQVRLLAELLDQFERRVVIPVRQAKREADTIVRDLQTTRLNFQTSLKTALGSVSGVWARPGSLSLAEGEELQVRLEETLRLHERRVLDSGQSEREAWVGSVGRDHFYFDQEDLSLADFFNPKFAVLRSHAHALRNDVANLTQVLDGVKEEIERLKAKEGRVVTSALSISVPQTCLIASELRRILVSQPASPSGEPPVSGKGTVVNLSDVRNILTERAAARESQLDALWDTTRLVRPLQELEASTRQMADELSRTLGSTAAAFQGLISPRIIEEGQVLIARENHKFEALRRRIATEDGLNNPAKLLTLGSTAKELFESTRSELTTFESHLKGVVDSVLVDCNQKVTVLKILAGYVLDMGDRDWIDVHIRAVEREIEALAARTGHYSDYRKRLSDAAEGAYMRVASGLGGNSLNVRALEIALRETMNMEYVGFSELRGKIISECSVTIREANSALDYLFEHKLLQPFVRRGVR